MPMRKKPEWLRDLQGRPGNQRKSSRSAVTTAAAPADGGPAVTPPAFLSAAARKVWQLVVPALQRSHLLAEPDALAFGRYCQWMAEYLALIRRARPVIVRTKSRRVEMDRLDRGFQARLLIDKKLMAYEDRFAMNPRERHALLAKLAADHGRVPAPPPANDPAENTDKPQGMSPVGFLGSRKLQ